MESTKQRGATFHWSRGMLALAFTCQLAARVEAGQVGAVEVDPPLVWDARAAEHLINRAGFGARPPEIARAVEMGAAAFVESLFAEPVGEEPRFAAERFDPRAARFAMGAIGREERAADPEARQRDSEILEGLRDSDQEQRDRYLEFWLERMLAAEHPLRERMTLFWRGYFTSSYRDVKNSYELITQTEFLRANALGRFSDLVRGIARDPAMLEYLDNDSNRKGQPNENFARELMELFTLGEGNYTEADVKEAARAFTGWTDEDGVFTFAWKRHDFGYKTVLGETGRLDGDDVLEILLAREACGQHVAGRLLSYFEGGAPPAERIAEYAALLREGGYDLTLFLRKLFLDPRFYRDEIVGTRVASPIDYLVGCSRRLSLEPPGRFLALGAMFLGERLFDPPNVKGWEGGEAWITTASLIERSNLVGVELGLVVPRDALSRGAGRFASAREAKEDDAREDDAPDLPGRDPSRRFLLRSGILELDLVGRVQAAGAESDEEIVDVLSSELLAVPPSPEIRAEALAFLAGERQALGADVGADSDANNRRWLAERRRAEPVLRRLAHFVLSLPDAHLN